MYKSLLGVLGSVRFGVMPPCMPSQPFRTLDANEFADICQPNMTIAGQAVKIPTADVRLLAH